MQAVEQDQLLIYLNEKHVFQAKNLLSFHFMMYNLSNFRTRLKYKFQC